MNLPVIICASGPSFDHAQQAEVIEARAGDLCRVVVINNQYAHVPNADWLYACDAAWYRVHIDKVRATFAGERWSQDDRCDPAWGVKLIRSVKGDGLPDEPDVISQGSNSGHQAIGFAVKVLGAQLIILVGYDMQRTGGEYHNHGRHEAPLGNGDPRSFIPRFEPLADALSLAGVTVYNASKETVLPWFERAPLQNALRIAIPA